MNLKKIEQSILIELEGAWPKSSIAKHVTFTGLREQSIVESAIAASRDWTTIAHG